MHFLVLWFVDLVGNPKENLQIMKAALAEGNKKVGWNLEEKVSVRVSRTLVRI